MELAEKLVELRKSTGMNRRQFSDYFGIPYRTVQDWELGNRHMPDYLFRLMSIGSKWRKARENWHDDQNTKNTAAAGFLTCNCGVFL